MSDPFEGYRDMGWVEGEPIEGTLQRLDDFIRENFTEVSREAHGTAVFRQLERRRTHCTCTWLGILDPSVTPVMVYDRNCGLLEHRLKADPPRQEP